LTAETTNQIPVMAGQAHVPRHGEIYGMIRKNVQRFSEAILPKERTKAR
jgi:hypothetical protein